MARGGGRIKSGSEVGDYALALPVAIAGGFRPVGPAHFLWRMGWLFLRVPSFRFSPGARAGLSNPLGDLALFS